MCRTDLHVVDGELIGAPIPIVPGLCRRARYTQGHEMYAFVSAGDDQAMRFAREVGAAWAGPSA